MFLELFAVIRYSITAYNVPETIVHYITAWLCPSCFCNEHHSSGLMAQWIRPQPTEPGILGSRPTGVTLVSI
eukprot:1754599-Amphidinium_carterae.1